MDGETNGSPRLIHTVVFVWGWRRETVLTFDFISDKFSSSLIHQDDLSADLIY